MPMAFVGMVNGANWSTLGLLSMAVRIMSLAQPLNSQGIKAKVTKRRLKGNGKLLDRAGR
jgi:hypothetical protein